jgi:hypothetical protein
MSEHLVKFRGKQGVVFVALPFDLTEMMESWSCVRAAMLKSIPDAFTRDEWAFLLAFLDSSNLRKPFQQSFGVQHETADSPVLLAAPRGPVGLWLPNNVSLLGPLMLILVSLTGSELRMKAGSRSLDLTEKFLDFARMNAPPGALYHYLTACAHHEVFGHDDPRATEMSRQSKVRIVFGSDEAVAAIHSLPHPIDSVAITFGDRRSEAWIELERCNETVLRDLIKVFAIYGQAGCTSPSRVVLLGVDQSRAVRIRDQIVELWPSVIRRRPAMNIVSDNVRAWQLARAAGWDSILVSENKAVVSVGEYDLKTFPSLMEMRVVPTHKAEARAHLTENIQTIGHALSNSADPTWLRIVAGTNIARFVPLNTMHHFETVWDGQDFWVQFFSLTRLKT